MTTDSERREVARLARTLAKNEFDFECDNVAKAIGANRHFPAQAWGRLADLIEPQTSEQTNHDESSLSASPIDRGVLLGLADDVEDSVKGVGVEGSLEWMLLDIVKSIREACGEVER